MVSKADKTLSHAPFHVDGSTRSAMCIFKLRQRAPNRGDQGNNGIVYKLRGKCIMDKVKGGLITCTPSDRAPSKRNHAVVLHTDFVKKRQCRKYRDKITKEVFRNMVYGVYCLCGFAEYEAIRFVILGHAVKRGSMVGFVHLAVFIDGVANDLGFDFNDELLLINLLDRAFLAEWIPEQTPRLILQRM